MGTSPSFNERPTDEESKCSVSRDWVQIQNFWGYRHSCPRFPFNVLREEMRDVVLHLARTVDEKNASWVDEPETLVLPMMEEGDVTETSDVPPIPVYVECEVRAVSHYGDMTPDHMHDGESALKCDKNCFLYLFGGAACFEWSAYLKEYGVPPLSKFSPGTSDYDWRFDVQISKPTADEGVVRKAIRAAYANTGRDESDIDYTPNIPSLHIEGFKPTNFFKIMQRRIAAPSLEVAKAKLSELSKALDRTVERVTRESTLDVRRPTVVEMVKNNKDRITEILGGTVVGKATMFEDAGLWLTCTYEGGYIKHQWTMALVINGTFVTDHVVEILTSYDHTKPSELIRLPSGVTVPGLNELASDQVQGSLGRMNSPPKGSQNAARALWAFNAVQVLAAAGKIPYLDKRRQDTKCWRRANKWFASGVAAVIAHTPMGCSLDAERIFRTATVNLDFRAKFGEEGVPEAVEKYYWSCLLHSVYGASSASFNVNVSGYWDVVKLGGFNMCNVTRLILHGNTDHEIVEYHNLHRKLRAAAASNPHLKNQVTETAGEEFTDAEWKEFAATKQWKEWKEVDAATRVCGDDPPHQHAHLYGDFEARKGGKRWRPEKFGDQWAWKPVDEVYTVK